MRIAGSIVIERPAADVFAWLKTPEKAREWMTSVSRTEILHEEPGGVGTTFRETVEEDGRGTELQGEITAWEPVRRIAFHLSGLYNTVDIEYRLAPAPGGTRLDQDAQVRFKPLLARLLGPLLRRKIEGQARRELARLKALCERGGPPAAT